MDPIIVHAIADLAARVEAALRAPIEQSTRPRFLRGYADLENAARGLGRTGWTIPMWARVDWLTDVHKAARTKEIDLIFLEMYSENGSERERDLLRVIETRPSLSYWHPLLGECVAAYHAQLFRTVIPCLLLILDGVVSKAGNRLTAKSDVKSIAAKERKSAAYPKLDWLLWLSVEEFLTQVFSSHPFSGNKPSLINRNWILHGRDFPAWTKIDALRLFQALDTTTYVLRHSALLPGSYTKQ